MPQFYPPEKLIKIKVIIQINGREIIGEVEAGRKELRTKLNRLFRKLKKELPR